MSRYSNDTVIILDTNGKPIVGAYTYFYEPGTTTLKSVFSDSDLKISQANPVRTLAGGIQPEIFIDGLYAVIDKDADDVALHPTQDPVGEIIAGQFEAYNSADTYAINEIVLATNGEYYISLVSSNQGNEPSVSVSQWQFIPVKDMVGLTETQTLTNKTLTNPTVTTGTFTSPDIDQVVDSSGNEVVIFGEVASAVNQITATNAATGNNPSLSPSGEADIDLDLTRTGGAAPISTMKLESEVVTTSGTSVEISSVIPTWAKRINVMFSGVSTNGVSAPMLQIGDSGGYETTGYISTAGILGGGAGTDATTGFSVISTTLAASELNGLVVLSLQKASTHTWVYSGTLNDGNTTVALSAGTKSLSATLDRIRITTVGGSDTFDSGAISINYEG